MKVFSKALTLVALSLVYTILAGCSSQPQLGYGYQPYFNFMEPQHVVERDVWEYIVSQGGDSAAMTRTQYWYHTADLPKVILLEVANISDEPLLLDTTNMTATLDGEPVKISHPDKLIEDIEKKKNLLLFASILGMGVDIANQQSGTTIQKIDLTNGTITDTSALGISLEQMAEAETKFDKYQDLYINNLEIAPKEVKGGYIQIEGIRPIRGWIDMNDPDDSKTMNLEISVRIGNDVHEFAWEVLPIAGDIWAYAESM